MSGAATCTTCGANVSIWCLCLCCSGAAILYSPRPGMGMCGTSVTWYRSCVAASRKSLSTKSGDMTNTRESVRDRRWCARRFIVRLTPSTCSQTDAKMITRRSAPYPNAPAPPLPTTSSSFKMGIDFFNSSASTKTRAALDSVDSSSSVSRLDAISNDDDESDESDARRASFTEEEAPTANTLDDRDGSTNVSRTHVISGHASRFKTFAFRSRRSARAAIDASWSSRWHEEYLRARSRSLSTTPFVHW
mmetsp:Transcript_13578/g.57091  ORF Transcript_13578/g.57091 Transcript_13578/m.57091 type:complete len:248 (+) Transcript_13578:1653-2396(+)